MPGSQQHCHVSCLTHRTNQPLIRVQVTRHLIREKGKAGPASGDALTQCVMQAYQLFDWAACMACMHQHRQHIAGSLLCLHAAMLPTVLMLQHSCWHYQRQAHHHQSVLIWVRRPCTLACNYHIQVLMWTAGLFATMQGLLT